MRNTLGALALAVLVFAPGNQGNAQQPVLQRGYDPGLSGANLTETTLTTSNVNPSTFGLVFTLPVDDKIYAQPLYVPQVLIPGLGVHNVLYVATMSDTLFAFDADVGGAPLWSVNFATSVGALPVPIIDFIFGGNTNITGNLGILSTPVIDPSTNIMYIVACTLENSTMVYRLHAINITNGLEPYPNVVISATYGGVTFNAAHQNQRASLTLSGDQVVFGFAAIEAESDDIGGYTGWVMGYNKQTLAQSGVFATVATGTRGGGVWQSGRPPVVDSSGFVYVFTGNGYTSGYDGVEDFSESALRLDPADGMALVDWFTPKNWSTMDQEDLDLASSGPLLIPGTNPPLIAGGGKTGVLYVLNTTDMGQYTATDSGVVQEETISASSLRGGPVYWQRSTANGGPLLYDWGTSDSVKAFAFNGSTFATTPAYQGSGSQIYPGGILTLSANGQTQGTGVLWATVAASGNVYNDVTDPGVLYAFDADNVATQLYSSVTNSTRDNFGSFAKFVPPTVANGKVYVATFSDQVAVYGLLPVTATPTLSPAPGSYTGTQLVTLTDATPGAVIYYTTNGTAPTTSSAQYVAGTPLSIGASETVEAMAAAGGHLNSATAGGSYTISDATVGVGLSSIDNVDGIGTVGTATSGGGLDTYGNSYAGNLLGASITWRGSTFTFGSANAPDAVSSATITLPAGNYVSLNMLATGVDGNQVNQVFVVTYTDGTTTSISQSLSDWFTPQSYPGESIVSSMSSRVTSSGAADGRTFNLYGYSFTLNGSKTVRSITLPNNRDVIVLAIDLVAAGTPAAVPTFNPAPGSYTGTQLVALSDTTPGAVIYYTTNGTAPTTSSAQYVAGTPLSINATETVQAIAVASGYSNSAAASGTYTITAPSATTPVSVGLWTEDNVDGIGTLGTATSAGGLDKDGSAYAGNLLGTSLTWAGATYTLGSANVADAVSSATIALPAGSYASLNMLATGVDGNQANQVFVVTYTDGTTTSITQSLSDWYSPQSYAGESIASSMAYRITSSGAADDRTFHLYGYSLALNASKTVQSITLPSNRDVVVLAIDLIPPGAATPIDNVYGIGTVGTAVSGGGLDKDGNAYAGNLLGSSLTWAGSAFTLGAANVADAISGETIALTAGNYASLNILATGVNGNQANQVFVVAYTDGTTTSITQSLSDWHTPQSYAGESIVSSMAYRVTSSGAAQDLTFNLYGYSFALNSAKTVQSITLPGNRNVVMLSFALVP
jgi:Chitobiase/beta-hexosaminidase C-terminal domain